MNTVTCPSCGTANSTENSACARCGNELTSAKLDQQLAELRKLTARMQQSAGPKASFSSFNGFGTTLLDYRPRGDGTYDTVRWVIALFIPLLPLSGYVIQPHRQERGYGGETSSFSVLEKTPLSPARVLRTYLLAVVGLFPILFLVFNPDMVEDAIGDGKAFLLGVVCFIWAVYIILFKVKNEGDAYKHKPVPLPPQV